MHIIKLSFTSLSKPEALNFSDTVSLNKKAKKTYKKISIEQQYLSVSISKSGTVFSSANTFLQVRKINGQKSK